MAQFRDPTLELNTVLSSLVELLVWLHYKLQVRYGISSIYSLHENFKIQFSNSLIIHEAKTNENHKCDGFGNVIKHLYILAKLSPLFSPEVCICLRSCIKHLH